MESSKNLKKEQKDKKVKDSKDEEERKNLLGFFSLLLKIDKRVSPYLYKSNSYEKQKYVKNKSIKSKKY